MSKLQMIEGVQPYERIYIGEVEAWEFCLENNIDKLPRKNGRQQIVVKSIAENMMLGRDYNEGIGKDENGFYLFKI